MNGRIDMSGNFMSTAELADAYWVTAWLAANALPEYERYNNWRAAESARARLAACAAQYSALTGKRFSLVVIR